MADRWDNLPVFQSSRAEQDLVIGDKSILSQQLEAATTSLEASKIENHVWS